MKNPLVVQSVSMAMVGLPFAVKGVVTSDTAASVTALLALACAVAVAVVAWWDAEVR